MIDHISIGVKNYDESFKFYKETLEILYSKDLKIGQGEYPPVTQEVDCEDPQTKYVFKAKATIFAGAKFASFIAMGCGISLIDLTYGIVEPLSPNYYGSPKGFHLSFKANSKQDVEVWYAKAIELGATCNGAPGPRPMYNPEYYGAFVIDPSGYRLEAAINSNFSK